MYTPLYMCFGLESLIPQDLFGVCLCVLRFSMIPSAFHESNTTKYDTFPKSYLVIVNLMFQNTLLIKFCNLSILVFLAMLNVSLTYRNNNCD